MTLPGPGDPATWPAPYGHPHDPRTHDTDATCQQCGTEGPCYVEEDADEDGPFVVIACPPCYYDWDTP